MTGEAGQHSGMRLLNRDFLLRSRLESQVRVAGPPYPPPPAGHSPLARCGHQPPQIDDHTRSCKSFSVKQKSRHLLCFQITQANICSRLLGKFFPCCLLGVQISSAALGEQPPPLLLLLPSRLESGQPTGLAWCVTDCRRPRRSLPRIGGPVIHSSVASGGGHLLRWKYVQCFCSGVLNLQVLATGGGAQAWQRAA